MATDKQITRIDDFFDGRRAGGNMDINDILVDPKHNARDFSLPSHRRKLDELKADILATPGVQLPVLVRFDAGAKKVYLVDGERRYRAVKELNAEGHEILLPVIKVAEKTLSEEQALERMLSTNTGVPLEQWEVGKTYARFIAFGWSVEKIASRFAKSERYVRDAIDLNDCPAEVKAELDAQTITVAVALNAIRKSGNNAAAVIQQKVAAAKAPGGTGKVVAQYVKRAAVSKVPHDLIKRLYNTLALYDAKDLNKLHAELEQYLPADKNQGKAAKELDEF